MGFSFCSFVHCRDLVRMTICWKASGAVWWNCSLGKFLESSICSLGCRLRAPLRIFLRHPRLFNRLYQCTEAHPAEGMASSLTVIVMENICLHSSPVSDPTFCIPWKYLFFLTSFSKFVQDCSLGCPGQGGKKNESNGTLGRFKNNICEYKIW